MMIDTNVVIDLVTPTSPWFNWAVRVMAKGTASGGVTASTIVVAELAAQRSSDADIVGKLGRLGVRPVDFDAVGGCRAGRAQAAYRAAGGKREKLLGDFLIGAHAVSRNVPLATRDPSYYRRYFPDLTLITPETENG
ncbi:type II toxin-antitoxin system VapC family toxin [Sphingosinithalassobacter sp. LHW66-3]|uniref:type II toxin-antitoxin system VapC family toxin n=1 Tax=Sphingosinithalassobacter sp. LHW66-3 TaxID=3424718 RepID=UPI003D6BEBCB